MNERIKELAEQAGIKFTPDWGECYTGNAQLERFAELIRQDEREACAKLCEEENWKKIAYALGQRVNFAVTNCECKTASILNTTTLQVTGWRGYMVEALEMIPGLKIDRELLDTFNLPPSKRKKAQKAILDERAALAKAKEST